MFNRPIGPGHALAFDRKDKDQKEGKSRASSLGQPISFCHTLAQWHYGLQLMSRLLARYPDCRSNLWFNNELGVT